MARLVWNRSFLLTRQRGASTSPGNQRPRGREQFPVTSPRSAPSQPLKMAVRWTTHAPRTPQPSQAIQDEKLTTNQDLSDDNRLDIARRV